MTPLMVSCWHQGKPQQSCHRGKTSSEGHWWGLPVITQVAASPPDSGTSSTSFGMIYLGLLLLNNIALVFLFFFYFFPGEKSTIHKLWSQLSASQVPGLLDLLWLSHCSTSSWECHLDCFERAHKCLFWAGIFGLFTAIEIAFVKLEIVNATQNYKVFCRPLHCRPYKIFKRQNLYIKFILFVAFLAVTAIYY